MKYRQPPCGRSNVILLSSPTILQQEQEKKNSVNRITKNKHDNQSFRLPFPKFKITNNKIRIEKIGWVKIVIDRGVPDNARFISCTVSRTVLVNISYQFL